MSGEAAGDTEGALRLQELVQKKSGGSQLTQPEKLEFEAAKKSGLVTESPGLAGLLSGGAKQDREIKRLGIKKTRAEIRKLDRESGKKQDTQFSKELEKQSAKAFQKEAGRLCEKTWQEGKHLVGHQKQQVD